ncbi:hypothetical protein E0H75_31540 [Kribbella capetownensis]|uniref:Uncharacterized protein n=1 Tax=Kribbella capetownensis TaxID=1572659 RepID=A0A4R0JE55_9ACTN|nr:hypothetical protein [Kribbella capetownensis]TCC45051.1 hypothetical protein E0H75_31540 [Kribbella capetownensis]
MKRAIVWVLSVAGLAAVLWLLIGAPDSGSENTWASLGGGPRTECKSALTTDAIPVHGVVDPTAVETCKAGQVSRLAWAVLIAMPTTVLTSIAVRRWNS